MNEACEKGTDCHRLTAVVNVTMPHRVVIRMVRPMGADRAALLGGVAALQMMRISAENGKKMSLMTKTTETRQTTQCNSKGKSWLRIFFDFSDGKAFSSEALVLAPSYTLRLTFSKDTDNVVSIGALEEGAPKNTTIALGSDPRK